MPVEDMAAVMAEIGAGHAGHAGGHAAAAHVRGGYQGFAVRGGRGHQFAGHARGYAGHAGRAYYAGHARGYAGRAGLAYYTGHARGYAGRAYYGTVAVIRGNWAYPS